MCFWCKLYRREFNVLFFWLRDNDSVFNSVRFERLFAFCVLGALGGGGGVLVSFLPEISMHKIRS